MCSTISVQQMQSLRKEFGEYLRSIHPEWSESSISTQVSDAFFAFNNNIGVDFWGSLASEDTLLEVRDKIHDYFAFNKQYDNPEARANDYLFSLRFLKSFLDAKKPLLAKEWNGKVASNTYLKLDFQAWMRRKKKSNGEPYSSNTINAYTTALKNSTGKLNLGDDVNTDLFYYINPDEFEEVHKRILAAPNFEEVDIAAANKAYSNSMVLYARFLQEISGQSSRNSNNVRVPIIDGTDDEEIEKKRYWLYSPGENARFWQEFSTEGLMGIGWEELGDLGRFSSRDEVKSEMKKIWGEDRSFRNDSFAVWQFANEIKPGDIVFAKQGLSTVIGRGIVESEYIFDATRNEYNSIRKVKWTHKGKWTHPGQAAMKTLTDVSVYTEYVEKLEALFIDEKLDVEKNELEIMYADYSENDFLDEVFMSAERYRTLKGLLKRKQNIILQGAPGVGKTFAAQRLAYSIIGKKDTRRVKVVQFHQSYSYEDFIMGYRPNDNGFSLEYGPFYKFCKEAEEDDGDFFFIIDEINRGNLSKIFGELLMLIENDKRGNKHSIRLLYKDEQFSVPKNVYIIGMMNTADRSLAMIDYALRRRFAFFEMEPAFASERFKSYQATKQSGKFDALISTIERLNTAISEDLSLGIGFRIGHSYFCTQEVIDDAWVSDIIEFEMVPLLNEYWFDEPAKVEQWTKVLRGAVRV